MKVSIWQWPTFLFCLQFLFVADVLSHPGHDHELTEKQAILRGKAVLRSLVRKQEPVKDEILDESWLEATNIVTCSDTPEYYLISFDNRTAGKRLYILLSSAGKYLRSNFDGQFAELIFSSYPVFAC